MAIEKYKITQIEIDSNNVKSAPNRLIGTAKENKNVFDRLAELTAAKINGIVDTLVSTIDGSSGANNIGSTPLKAGGTTTVQGQLKELKAEKIETNNIISEITVANRLDVVPNEKAINDKMIAIGAGDMAKSVYDPKNQAKDVFAEISAVNVSLISQNRGKNLLHNWYFKKPINVRGFTTYTCSGNIIHTIDRWFAGYFTNVTLENESLTLVNQSSKGTTDMTQKLEEDLSGLTVTFSIDIDGVISSKTVDVPVLPALNNVISGISFSWGAFVLVYFTDKYFGYTIRLNASQSVSGVKRAKIEIGSKSTLANDPPMDYGEELTKCQRYQLGLNGMGSAYGCVGTGIAETATICTIDIPLPTTMRTLPVASFFGNWCLYDGVSVFAAINISVGDRYAENGITVIVSAAGLTAGKVYTLRANNDVTARLMLSANLQ